MHAVCVGVVVVGSLLLVPATASAKARVGIADNNPLMIVSGDDEPDRVSAAFDQDASAFVFAGEEGTLLESTGLPCVERSGTTVTCPADGIRGLRFRLGPGNDQVTVVLEFPGNTLRVEGGSGHDLLRLRDVGVSHLIGGAGKDSIHARGRGPDRLVGGDGDDSLTVRGQQGDRLSGGRGDDVLRTRGGGADRAHCGKGADTVIADSSDIVSSDCETVRRS